MQDKIIVTKEYKKPIIDDKEILSAPLEIIDFNPILLFTILFPKISFIYRKGEKCYKHLLHGFVVPDRGISKIFINIGNSRIQLLDYKIITSKYLKYEQSGDVFDKKEESIIKWINPFRRCINTHGVFYSIYMEVYDIDGKLCDNLDLVLSYIDSKNSYSIGKFTEFFEVGNVQYMGDFTLSVHSSNKRVQTKINLKLINKLCRNRYNRKREILRKYLYKNLLNVVFSY